METEFYCENEGVLKDEFRRLCTWKDEDSDYTGIADPDDAVIDAAEEQDIVAPIYIVTCFRCSCEEERALLPEERQNVDDDEAEEEDDGKDFEIVALGPVNREDSNWTQYLHGLNGLHGEEGLYPGVYQMAHGLKIANEPFRFVYP